MSELEKRVEAAERRMEESTELFSAAARELLRAAERLRLGKVQSDKTNISDALPPKNDDPKP